jgi:hypothetical protein
MTSGIILEDMGKPHYNERIEAFKKSSNDSQGFEPITEFGFFKKRL